MLSVLLYIALFLFVAGVVMFFVFGRNAQIGGGCDLEDFPLRLKLSIICIIGGIALFILWAILYFFFVFLV